MSRILGYTTPFAGHLFPVIGTLLEVRERGYDVHMALGPVSVGLAPTPTADRPRVMPIESWAVPRSDGGTVLRVAAPEQSADDFDERLVYGAPAADDLTALIAEAKPQALVVDATLWGAMIAAEASGLPFVSLAHSSRNIPTESPRLFGPGLAPPTGTLGRWRQRLAAAAATRLEDLNMLPHVNSVRERYGLSRIAHVHEQYYRAVVTVACTAEPFEYRRSDWHRSVRFVGPILWEPPAETPGWVHELNDRPVVLVSTSSVAQPDDQLVELTFRALAEETVQVVATVLTGRAPGPTPKNARAAAYLPHQHFLPRATCLVCHAGLGVTQKALSAGVPVVAAPFARDQFEVARRVEVAQAGVLIRPTELTPERLRSAVRAAPAFKPGAERVADAFRKAGGARAAATAIDQSVLSVKSQGFLS